MNQVDTYISQFPPETQKLLQLIRETIKIAAPLAEEVISYKMPAYKQNGMLVYFAGYKKHIGFYPTSSGIRVFKEEFKKYTWSPGAIQFPLGEPLPVDLITRITQFRVRENLEKEKI